MSNFSAQLGNKKNPGWQPGPIPKNENPFCVGSALAPNSPLFFGRTGIHHTICSRLLSAQKPQSVSLLGERRCGKSSLLHQVQAALAQQPNLLVVYANMQGFTHSEQAQFFYHLHRAMCQGLQMESATVDSFEGLRDFIAQQAQQYRFVIMLDEAELLIRNAKFSNDFLNNLRTLANAPEYRLGYVTATRLSLKKVCYTHQKEESTFWGIFGIPYVLGLLTEQEALALINRPCQATVGTCLPSEEAYALSGQHPYFIQLAMWEVWQAYKQDKAVEWPSFRYKLHTNYYQPLWDHRNEAEKNSLYQLAKGIPITKDSTYEELAERGLLLSPTQFFAEEYANFVRQQNQPPSPKDLNMPKLPPNQPKINPVRWAKETLEVAITAVPSVKYALGIAGIAAALSFIFVFLSDWRTALFGGVGMFFFMVLLVIFADVAVAKTIPKKLRLTLLWFIVLLFMAFCLVLFSSLFFQWPLPLGAWAI